MNNAISLRMRSIIGAAGALLAASLLLSPELPYASGAAQAQAVNSQPRAKRGGTATGHTKPAAPGPAPSTSKQLPPRIPFTAAEDAAAAVPGIPDARFWADSETDYANALPAQPGPWLILSSGGSDGAFGAGLMTGLTAAGKRPDYQVVTGVSTGALMAPFIFAGPRYDEQLRKAYTQVSAADIFEAGSSTGESFVNSWPLRDFIAKQITPELMADVAAAHRAGRRLFVVTTNLDTERSVVWNMGAIAAHGGERATKLFCSILLASASVPGGFPPVMINVEANGKHFTEMHVDGGLGGQFFVAPAALMGATSQYHLPATALYVVVNTGLQPNFKVVDRFAPTILTQSIDMAVPVDTRLMIDRAYLAAKRSGINFNIATIPTSFHAPSAGAFDPKYMGALFKTGVERGRGANAFSDRPPPYPAAPASLQPNRIEKTGANR
ncbi:MAG: patatin-like phospholipase family protein [Hyphomicrobiales bacterium]|nr:patatin-like phospholipase family protein [Hyphomicrobiales bacterium]